MPPARSGYVEALRRADGPYFVACIKLDDGSRERVRVPDKHATRTATTTPREHAELYAQALQEHEDETHERSNAKRLREAETARPTDHAERGDLSRGESCAKYFGRLTLAREADGVRDVRKERTIWGKWLAPRIGRRSVIAVTRDEIEGIRDLLDEHVRRRIKGGLTEGISGATAANVWSVLRTMFKESVSSRDRTMRLRLDDPMIGHKPPLSTPKRSKTFVYPAEFSKLLACRDVPREWREVYSVAAYAYGRAEELEALVVSDVDLDAGTIQISKAIGSRDGKPKPLPKTENAVRAVPIEPALRPLLLRLIKDRAGDAPLLPALRTLNDKHRAKQFREHLRVAGVTRPRLFAETATLLLQVDFRSCRDTGITWLALAGVELARMQRRAGHEDITTTLGYVKMAEDLSGKVGIPFAPLPRDLLSRRSPRGSPRMTQQGAKIPPKACRRRESNPRPSAYETPALTN